MNFGSEKLGFSFKNTRLADGESINTSLPITKRALEEPQSKSGKTLKLEKVFLD